MSFPLIGNERVKQALEKQGRRLPHAVIIEGDSGTGKRTLARYLAKRSVCEAQDAPCNSCRSCRLADAGTHPDIQIVTTEDKKKSITVGQIRELRSMAYLAAHTATGRVFIIEKADTMNGSAQNSLLKVLEEPPDGVVFLLLTESANRLLETVVSRCAVFSLFPPEPKEALERVCALSSADPETAASVLKDTKNNIGKALEILSGALQDKGTETARRYFEAVCAGLPLDALKCAAALEKDRPAAGNFVSELKELLCGKIKESAGLKETRREFTRMYDAVCAMEPLLITNINLALFFTSLTSRLMSVKNS